MSNLLTRKDSGKKDFSLNDTAIAHAISIHINNMFATYGTQTVKTILKELYNIDLGMQMINEIKIDGGVDAACPQDTIPEKYLGNF